MHAAPTHTSTLNKAARENNGYDRLTEPAFPLLCASSSRWLALECLDPEDDPELLVRERERETADNPFVIARSKDCTADWDSTAAPLLTGSSYVK
jgi:hypothetical protein